MKDLLIIDNPETAKVLADRTRRRILHLLKMGEHSARELAEFLGVSPQAVAYHLRVLRRHGLIEVAREERKGNLIERYYRASAKVFIVSYVVFESEEFGERARDIALEAIETLGLRVDRDTLASMLSRYLALKSKSLEEVLSRRRRPLCREVAPVVEFLAVMRMASTEEFASLLEEFRRAGVW